MRSPLWILVGLGCLLRLTGLTVHSLWYDECATLHVATAIDPIAVLHGDRHPPLSFLAFRVWIGWFGEDDLVLRLLPAIVSCATLSAFAMLVRRWSPPRAALAATALLACSPFAIWYGQEVRMYSFVELATVLAVLGVTSLAADRPRRGAVLVVAGTFLALGSHYLGGTVAAQVAALSATWPMSRRRRTLALVAAGLGVMPWLPWMWQVIPDQLAAPWGFQARLGAGELLTLPVRFVLVQLAHLPPVLVYATAGLLAVGLARTLLGAVSDRGARAASILAATPILAALALAAVMPANFAPNYLIAAAPWIVLAAAHGLSAMPKWLRPASALLPMAAMAQLLLLRQENLREDYRGACRDLLASLQPGDRIVTITGTPEAFSQAPLRHYLREVPDLDTRLVEPQEAIAMLEASPPTSRLHVVWRAADYALPLFDALRAAGEVRHSDPVRHRVQHLVMSSRRP